MKYKKKLLEATKELIKEEAELIRALTEIQEFSEPRAMTMLSKLEMFCLEHSEKLVKERFKSLNADIKSGKVDLREFKPEGLIVKGDTLALKLRQRYIPTGDGECQFTDRCLNYYTDYCYECMYNTGATPRDHFEGKEELNDRERDLIES